MNLVPAKLYLIVFASLIESSILIASMSDTLITESMNSLSDVDSPTSLETLKTD